MAVIGIDGKILCHASIRLIALNFQAVSDWISGLCNQNIFEIWN